MPWMIFVRLFLFLSLLFPYSLSAAIPVYLNLDLVDEYASTGEGYTSPASSRNGLQQLFLEYDADALGVTWANFFEGGILINDFSNSGLSKRTISLVSGKVEDFEYPLINYGVSYASIYMNHITPYSLDVSLNTVWAWDESSGLWTDLRSEVELPSGNIYDIYFTDNYLNLIVVDGSNYTFWQLTDKFERIDEIDYRPERIISHSSAPMILSGKYVKKVGSDFTKVSFGIEELRPFNSADDKGGILFTEDKKDGGKLVWYSYSDDLLTMIEQPELSQGLLGCGSYYTAEIYCTFQVGVSEIAIYKLKGEGFQLDSVFTFSDGDIDLEGVSLFALYGENRVIQIKHEESNSTALIEISPYASKVLSSAPEPQTQYLLGIHPADGKNYFFRSSESGWEINRYDISEPVEVISLVNAEDYPEYRILKNEEKSSSHGFGSLTLELLFMLLVFLMPVLDRSHFTNFFFGFNGRRILVR